jgi:hypothetical protein
MLSTGLHFASESTGKDRAKASRSIHGYPKLSNKLTFSSGY